MARDAFRSVLGAVGVCDTHWRRGLEPPDFYLRVDRRSFAVEVTRVMEKHAVGGLSIPTHGVRAALEKLAQDVQDEARRRGILSGSYGMNFAPVADLRGLAPRLVADTLRYIEATQAVTAAPRTVLVSLPHGRSIAIQKVAASPDRVGSLMVIGPVKRAHVVQEELIRLLRETLDRKRASLSRVRLPRILLLVDSYLYGDLEHWRYAAERTNMTGFHTVARIADLGVCHVLHSEEAPWSRLTTARS